MATEIKVGDMVVVAPSTIERLRKSAPRVALTKGRAYKVVSLDGQGVDFDDDHGNQRWFGRDDVMSADLHAKLFPPPAPSPAAIDAASRAAEPWRARWEAMVRAKVATIAPEVAAVVEVDQERAAPEVTAPSVSSAARGESDSVVINYVLDSRGIREVSRHLDGLRGKSSPAPKPDPLAEAREKFPIGCRVRLVDNTGSAGCVTDHVLYYGRPAVCWDATNGWTYKYVVDSVERVDNDKPDPLSAARLAFPVGSKVRTTAGIEFTVSEHIDDKCGHIWVGGRDRLDTVRRAHADRCSRLP